MNPLRGSEPTVETLKKITEFFNVRKFREILRDFSLVRILEISNFT